MYIYITLLFVSIIGVCSQSDILDNNFFSPYGNFQAHNTRILPLLTPIHYFNLQYLPNLAPTASSTNKFMKNNNPNKSRKIFQKFVRKCLPEKFKIVRKADKSAELINGNYSNASNLNIMNLTNFKNYANKEKNGSRNLEIPNMKIPLITFRTKPHPYRPLTIPPFKPLRIPAPNPWLKATLSKLNKSNVYPINRQVPVVRPNNFYQRIRTIQYPSKRNKIIRNKTPLNRNVTYSQLGYTSTTHAVYTDSTSVRPNTNINGNLTNNENFTIITATSIWGNESAHNSNTINASVTEQYHIPQTGMVTNEQHLTLNRNDWVPLNVQQP